MRPIAPYPVNEILRVAAEKGYTVKPWPDHQDGTGLVGGWTLSHADWHATMRTIDDQWVVVLKDQEATSASGVEAFYELMLGGWLEDLNE